MARNPRVGQQDPQVSRREFLGTAGAGAVTATFAGALPVEAAPLKKSERIQEMRADVVIAGSGIGGMTAAVRAVKAGARVIVLEKAAQFGGTARESAGAIWTYNSYEDMRHDAPEGDPDLQRTIFENINRAYEFYDGIGVPLGAPPAPGMRMRAFAPVPFMNGLLRELEAGGGQLLVDTPMIRLLTNRQNEVIGALAHGPNGPVNVFGKAVILATGGWPGNAQMVQANITRHFGSLHQRNCAFNGLQPLLTGDGFVAARQIGAAESDGGFDSFYGHLLPVRPSTFSHPLTNYSIYHIKSGVALNVRGERFTDESHGRAATPNNLKQSGEELVAQETARQPQATAIYIWDHEVNQTQALAGQTLGNIDKYEAFRMAGAPVAMGNTVEELARNIEAWGRGVPAANVAATLNEFNQAAAAGRAWALLIPKQDASFAKPIAAPPFYAVMGQAGITGPHGGLKVNPQGQVLDRGEKPIPGLYAAGIDIGNINNHVYLGFLVYGAVFGYITGPLAAQQPEPRGGFEIGPMS